MKILLLLGVGAVVLVAIGLSGIAAVPTPTPMRTLLHENPQATPSQGIRFDPTINLGQIATVVALLAALFAGYSKLMVRIAVIESRVADLWKDFMDRVTQ